MPKVVPFKLRRLLKGPIAARTRLQLGIPICRPKSAQYPCEYIGTNGRSSNKKTKPIKSRRRFVAPTLKSKEANGENDYDGMDNRHKMATRRPSHNMDADDGILQFEPSKRTRIQKAITSRPIHKSLIQVVNIKTAKRKKDKDDDKIRKGRRKAGAQARKQSRGRKRVSKNHSKKRVSKRRLRKRPIKERSRKRKVTRQRGRRQRQASSQRSKRRSGGKRLRRKKRASQLKKKRQRTSKRRRGDESEEDCRQRRKDHIPGPSPSHEKDTMLTAQEEVVTNSWDEGRDNVKDDPLNVKDICRSLVKGLHGIPADCREESTNDKRDRPELEKPSDSTKRRQKAKSRRQRRSRRSNKTSGRNKKKARAYKRDRRRRQRPANRKHGSKSLLRKTPRLQLTKNNKQRVDRLARKVDRKGYYGMLSRSHRYSNSPDHTNHIQRHPRSRVHKRHRDRRQKATRQKNAKRLYESKLRRQKLAKRAHAARLRNRNNSWATEVNKNNNQDSDNYWYRVTGRLTRVSYLIFRRLCQLWRE